MSNENNSPAKLASEQALAAIYKCLKNRQSFLLEAGAGAGKTYSLVEALRFLITEHGLKLSKNHQRIACITFTNVAKEEIEARTDRNPLIFCDTTHAFCWSLVGGFQKQLRQIIPTMSNWSEKLKEIESIGERIVEYSLGLRSVTDDRISIHHDDVIPIMISLMENEKFRRIVTDKHPFILIDEYQDTDADWIQAIKDKFLGQSNSPLFGFFGDHWQKIYGNGCGHIEHSALTRIAKEANFRSVPIIVDCLNKMRPDLPQQVEKLDEVGSVQIFHTNNWPGQRQTGQHWNDDLPSDDAHSALQNVLSRIKTDGWDLSENNTKILMLTHRGLAKEQGYASLPSVFRYNDAFTKKDDECIAYFIDKLEPACEAYKERKFGQMFEALGGKIPAIQAIEDKMIWANAMNQLLTLREEGTVGQVIEHLRKARHPRLPDVIETRKNQLENFDKNAGDAMPNSLSEFEKLLAIPYKEIICLATYLSGYSPFETKHGVKGAEFENVLVVVGRGWNQYNFNEMFELAQNSTIPTDRHDAYERNRNLFYVTCSRPKRRLALLFTQKLSNRALGTLENWFGASTIQALNF